MAPLRRSVIKERESAVSERVTEINRRLKHLSDYTVTYFPLGREIWYILPAIRLFQEDGFPILGNKFSLLITENLGTSADKLTFTYFRYRLRKISDVSTERVATDRLPMDWEFRYEFDLRGEEHAMPRAGEPDALQDRTGDRFPPFHMHVYEKSTIGDDLHYPLGIPERPFDLLFEVIRLIRDEFIG
jgi:hypothetical protein